VSKWLSPEWFDETQSMRAGLSGPAGLSARIQVEITGGPEREVRCHGVIEDGRLVSSAAGAVDAPDVTLTIGWDDAVAMQVGDLDPNVAFMQGRMKVVGSMDVMMALLPRAHSPESQDLRRRIASFTEF
jgi:putative sterol carrier protein